MEKSKIEKINKGYAFIYVDREGESLTYGEDFTHEDMISEYYNMPGPIQWNFYLIIAKEFVPKNKVEEILDNDKYTRKLIVPLTQIDSFIKERFPDVMSEVGKMTLVKGRNWADALELFKKEKALNDPSKSVYPSWYRDDSSLDTLNKMDILRAELITNPKLDCIFYTHLSSEEGWAKKKFHLFIKKA
jgi:hypothetical protein